MNEAEWDELGEQAMWIVDALLEQSHQLDRIADHLGSLIAKAADLPAPAGDEERKRSVIQVWRATLAQIERMRGLSVPQ